MGRETAGSHAQQVEGGWSLKGRAKCDLKLAVDRGRLTCRWLFGRDENNPAYVSS